VRKGDGGKHVAADLLVSRRGFRRVIPDDAGLDVEASELQELARVHLTGRVAAVFDAFVLRPLLTGDARASVESLAADFGVSQRRIYKDLVRAQRQLSDAWRLLLDEEAKRVLGGVRAFRDDLAARHRQFEELTRADSSLKDFSPSSYAPEGFTRVSYQRSSSPWPVIRVLFVMPSIRGRFAVTPSTAVKGLRLSYSPIFTTATGYTTAVNTSATAVSSATTKYFSP
jgi:hypothetical protein